jgi:hypothetical protein
VVLDRAWLLEKHHKGYSQIAKDWCEQLGLLEFFYKCDLPLFRSSLVSRRELGQDSDWEIFSSMPSTRFAASIFCSRKAVYFTVMEASRLSRLAVRVILLAVSGSLSMSYMRSKVCHVCGERFDFEHFLSCRHLGVALEHRLAYLVMCEEWREAAFLLLSRFQVFIHAARAGEVTSEENELFDLLVDWVDSEDEARGGDVVVEGVRDLFIS